MGTSPQWTPLQEAVIEMVSGRQGRHGYGGQSWACLANPRVYRIDDALLARDGGTWTTQGRGVAAGVDSIEFQDNATSINQRRLVHAPRSRDATQGFIFSSA
jgi:hypothetical protein